VDNDDQTDVKLRVGDIVDILEDLSINATIISQNAETTTRVSYAQIKAIFLHTKENFQVPFLLLDWFISQDTIDQKLGCPLYKLQQPIDYTWRHIYAIKCIDHQPNIHFIHCCKSSCINGKCFQNNIKLNLLITKEFHLICTSV